MNGILSAEVLNFVRWSAILLGVAAVAVSAWALFAVFSNQRVQAVLAQIGGASVLPSWQAAEDRIDRAYKLQHWTMGALLIVGSIAIAYWWAFYSALAHQSGPAAGYAAIQLRALTSIAALVATGLFVFYQQGQISKAAGRPGREATAEVKSEKRKLVVGAAAGLIAAVALMARAAL